MTTKNLFQKTINCEQTNLFQVKIVKLLFLFIPRPSNRWFNAFFTSSLWQIFEEYSFQHFNSQHDGFFGWYIYRRLPNCFHSNPISHSKETYVNNIYPAYTKKADPHLLRMILLNKFHIFQINKINFAQYLKMHKHPDTFIEKRKALNDYNMLDTYVITDIMKIFVQLP